jgi:hypothetical protein
MVERVNKEIVDWLNRSLADDWDVQCYQVAYGINVSPSRRSGFTPYEVMFGVPPTVARYVPEEEFARTEKEEEEALENNYLRRRDLGNLVREHMRSYEDKREGYKIGGLVWTRNFKRKKFDPKWLGPSVISEVRQHSVTVKGENGVSRILNKGDVKHYRKPLGEEMRD